MKSFVEISIVSLTATKDGTPLPQLLQSLGHILLCPYIKMPLTLHDKHPKKLVDDLLLHHGYLHRAGLQVASREPQGTCHLTTMDQYVEVSCFLFCFSFLF